MAALSREAALCFPGYHFNSPLAPSDFDSLISGYRLAQTALLETATVWPNGGALELRTLVLVLVLALMLLFWFRLLWLLFGCCRCC